MRIVAIDPADPRVAPLLEAHLRHSWDATPQTSNHTMTAGAMAKDHVSLFAAFDDADTVGCGGLKDLGDGQFEVKSVHVSEAARGRGVARAIMAHLTAEAQRRGARALVLETGSEILSEYDAARALYERLGFHYCGPIPGYAPDPNSAFMRLPLDGAAEGSG